MGTLAEDLIDDSEATANDVPDNSIDIYPGLSPRIQFINNIIILCHEIKTTPKNDQLQVEQFQTKLLRKIRKIEKTQLRMDNNFESGESSDSCELC